MQVEMIKWLAYPENIPVIEKIYDLTYKSLGVLMVGEDSWLGDRWRYCDDDKVIAYSEKAKPYDPTAKQFNFWTALEMMKSGVLCIDLSTGDEIRMQFRESEDRYFEKYAGNGVWHPYKLDARQVTGLWEVANAD